MSFLAVSFKLLNHIYIYIYTLKRKTAFNPNPLQNKNVFKLINKADAHGSGAHEIKNVPCSTGWPNPPNPPNPPSLGPTEDWWMDGNFTYRDSGAGNAGGICSSGHRCVSYIFRYIKLIRTRQWGNGGFIYGPVQRSEWTEKISYCRTSS